MSESIDYIKIPSYISNNPRIVILVTTLLIGFLYKIALAVFAPLPYWYDEIVYINMSKLPLSQIQETLLADPIPIGFPLLIKLLPTDNLIATRLAIAGFTYIVTITAVLYGLTTKTIQQYKLEYGLSFFLVSFSFLDSTSYVKSGTFSVPFAVLFAILLISVLSGESNRNTIVRRMLILHTIAIITLLISYQLYAALFISLVYVTYKHYKSSQIKMFFLSHVIIVSIYCYTILMKQVPYLNQRSIWQSFQYNSLLYSIRTSLTGLQDYTLATDFGIFGFLFLLFRAMWRPILIHSSRSLLLKTMGLVLLLYSACYFLNLLPRARFTVFPFLLSSIIIGWSLYQFRFRTASAILAGYLILGFSSFSHAHIAEVLYTSGLVEVIARQYKQTTQDNERIFVVGDIPLLPYVLKWQYFSSSDWFIPASLTHGLVIPYTISKEIMLLDTNIKQSHLSPERIMTSLHNQQFNQLWYIMNPSQDLNGYYYDNSRIALKTLSSACLESELTTFLTSSLMLYRFQSCSF